MLLECTELLLLFPDNDHTFMRYDKYKNNRLSISLTVRVNNCNNHKKVILPTISLPKCQSDAEVISSLNDFYSV